MLVAELQPRVRGWLLASVDGQKQGYVPANRVRVLGKRTGSGQPAATAATAATEPTPPTPDVERTAKTNGLDSASSEAETSRPETNNATQAGAPPELNVRVPATAPADITSIQTPDETGAE